MEAPKKKRKLWDESSMVSAMEAVSTNSMKVAELLDTFLFPESYLKKRVTHGKNPGPLRVLSDEEKRGLVEYIKYMARGGFPMTSKIICAYAWLFQREMENHQDFQQLVQVGIGGVIFVVDILNLPYVQQTNWTVKSPKCK